MVPELIFDQGIGDLYVLRVAGNILDDAVLGSIEYGVGELGINLVVVMGHEGCGAVKATFEKSDDRSPHLDELARAMQPAVDRAMEMSGDRLANAVQSNAQHVVEQLEKHEIVLGPKVRSGELQIRAAYYNSSTGAVDFLPDLLEEEEPSIPSLMPGSSHAAVRRAEVHFDTHATTMEELVLDCLATLDDAEKITNEQRRRIEGRLLKAGRFAGADDLGHGVGVVRMAASELSAPRVVLARCPGDDFRALDGAILRFVWVVFGPSGASEPNDEELEPFGWMLVDDRFSAQALEATSSGRLLAAYESYLRFLDAPPETTEEEIPPELRRTGRLFGGLLEDVKRRLPFYRSDFTDGFHGKTLASVLFLFFACFAPAVAFGGLLSVLTNGQVGAVEMIVGTAVCGVIYALFSGQPLTILGSTGPVIVFMGIVYELCQSLGVPYFPALAWIGMWTALILVILSAVEAASLIRFFTRFTDETFAALISMIFIVEAMKDTFKGFTTEGVPHDTALLSLILAIGTFLISQQLSRFRRSVYLRARYRDFLADFGPAIAIVLMTGVAVWLHPVRLEKLAVPETISTTSGRPWLVDPFTAPTWFWFASIVPAILVSILLYLDQNITVRLVNDKRYKLKKGAGYNLDLFILGLLIGFCSLFGLPWMVAATVRSINHVRSLAVMESHGGEERIVSVRENRVSGLVVHAMVGVSLLFLTYLAEVPMSVLFGLFLYMGVASMRNNQFFERLRLWVMDPKLQPPTHYLRRVPSRVVHKFTAIQLACLAVLWAVKVSIFGIVFPLFIGMLVPVRFLLNRFFDHSHLAFLDAEEEPEEEDERVLD